MADKGVRRKTEAVPVAPSPDRMGRDHAELFARRAPQNSPNASCWRTAPSPSPRPSPQRRGRIVGRLSATINRLEESRDWMRELPLPKGEVWGEGDGSARRPKERVSAEDVMGTSAAAVPRIW